MIELIATAESTEQAKALLEAGVDILYIGEKEFGLRMPGSLTRKDMEEIAELAHSREKKLCTAVNALMDHYKIKKVRDYLKLLEGLGIDAVTVGDPGVIHLINHKDIRLPYWYDGHTMVTNSRQVNFWARRGAVGAVLSREITLQELQAIRKEAKVPVEVQVYGATCIHHSKRLLVANYFHDMETEKDTRDGFYLSEPKNLLSHYTIYQDNQGTHIFATNDLNLLPYLEQLTVSGLERWKLDGIHTPGENFTAIARLFAEAKEALNTGKWTEELKKRLNEELYELHPKERTMNAGYFLKKQDEVL